MKKAIIGKKVGMTQIFDEVGKVIPVTVIEAGPCVVVQKMTKEKEGYDAVQFGYEEVAEKKLSQPEALLFLCHIIILLTGSPARGAGMPQSGMT